MKSLLYVAIPAILTLVLLTLTSCATDGETDTGAPFKGLLTITSSGITYIDCQDNTRYRILDGQHKVGDAMGERVITLNEPVYIEMDGSLSEFDSNLEFEQQFSQMINVTEVTHIDNELPSSCDHHIKPILSFVNPIERITIEFNYFVPAVILQKPLYGWLMYFPLQDEKFQKIHQGESLEVISRSHGEEIKLRLEEMICATDEESDLWSHHLEIVFRGEAYPACGGSKVEDGDIVEGVLLSAYSQ